MKGSITQIIGPVVDVRFEQDLPTIQMALTVKRDDHSSLTLEVAQHLGYNVVRTIAMSSTDGLRRGMEVVNTGKAMTVSVGPETLGRMVNVTGDPIDNMPAVKGKRQDPI